MIEHLLESLGAGERVLRRLLKEVEKLFFVRNEVKQGSLPFGQSRIVLNRRAKPLSMKCYDNMTKILRMFRSEKAGFRVNWEQFSNTRTYFIADLAEGRQLFFFASLRCGRIPEGPMRTLRVVPQCRAPFAGVITEGYYLIDSFERYLG